MIVQLRFRRGTSAEWAAANPVLANGEPAYDSTQDSFKIGDGTRPWNELSYQTISADVLNSLLTNINQAQTAATAATTAAQTAAAQATAAAASITTGPTDVKGKFYLAIGQSNNMYGSPVDDVLDVPESGVYQYPGSGPYMGRIIPAKDPLYHEQGQVGVGHVMSFSRLERLALPKNEYIIILPYAHGSTGFSNPDSGFGTWNHLSTGAAKNLAVGVRDLALELVAKGHVFGGILFHQGEGSATHGDSLETYIAYVTELVSYLRTTIPGGEDVPFVYGQMLPEGIDGSPAKQVINAAHIEMQRRIEFSGFWYADYGYAFPGSADHFTSQFQREIAGPRAFQAMRRARLNTPGNAPVPPAKVTATQVGGNAVATWTQPMSRFTGFTVQSSVNGGAFTTMTHSTVDVTSTKTGLVAGNTVQFRVRTTNEIGPSTYTTSNTITIGGAPGKLLGLTPGTPTSSTVPMTATTLSAAATYSWEYKKSTDTTWIVNGTSSTPSYTYTGLLPSTAYNFRGQGVNAGGSGPYSDAVNATTTAIGVLMADVAVPAFYAHSLRKVVTAYAGPAVKVRRATDNTTLDVGFVSGNLDTAALLTFANGGSAYVDTWYDQSGNARHAVQTNAGFQPMIVNAGSLILNNGKPYLTFTPSNFFSDSVVGLYAAGHASGLAVVKSSSASQSQSGLVCEVSQTTATPVYGLVNHASTWRILTFVRDDSNTIMVNTGATGGLLTLTPHVAFTVDTGTQTNSGVDGGQNIVLTYDRAGHVLSLNGRQIGRFGSGFLGAEVAEVVSWSVDLNTAQGSAAVSNPKNYYGL